MKFETIPFGKPEAFNVRIEISEGSKVKYEFNEDYQAFQVNFVFRHGFFWPFNYGEIFGTLAGDGDKLDAIVLSSQPLAMGSIVLCRPVAMAEIIDRGEVDNKIFCVPIVDGSLDNYQDLDSFSEEQLRSYEDFFRELAMQKNKILEVKGFHGKARTIEEIEKSVIK